MQALTTVAEIQVSYQPAGKPIHKISTSKDAYDILMNYYPQETIHLKEHFVVLYLNNANKVMGVYRLSEGGMTATVADVRIVLGIALKVAARGLIISHNHPSGEIQPSGADKAITKKLKEACLLMDLTLCDHIIVSGNGDYYSFCDGGEM
jgi:DNA repair protein RadC